MFKVLKLLKIFALLAFMQQEAFAVDTGCPLDLSGLDYKGAISACSSEGGQGLCCRYVNALVGVSVARYTNQTGQLGVPMESFQACLGLISDTFDKNGISRNSAALCGLGPKIPVDFRCKGLETVGDVADNPNFKQVAQACVLSSSTLASLAENCKKCMSSTMSFLHQLVGTDDHMALSTCRDAVFVSIASTGDLNFTIHMSNCFFGLPDHGIEQAPAPDYGHLPKFIPPVASSPSAPFLSSPVLAPPQHTSVLSTARLKKDITRRVFSSHHLALVPSVGIGVTGIALALLVYTMLLICKKRQELSVYSSKTLSAWNKPFSKESIWKLKKWRKGPHGAFQRYSYKEIKKATNDFCMIIGKGGFGTVYKAVFDDGLVAAVKRMDKISQQGESEFSKEMELLGRLHHRHLVTLRGFCAEKQERFLVYEYMENGSLKEHLHSSMKSSMDWHTRIQVAVDVATALEYLHFFCDPPLCHRDIKSSNILLDENFVAKVADFGLAHAAPTGSIKFEPINTDIRGTPGYMDPEYVTTQELTQKSDIYSYGVLLLELVTARRAVHENKNLVEWVQPFIMGSSRLKEIVDPMLEDRCNVEELQSVVSIAKLCVQPEGKARPSMKQVLRLLYEKLDTGSHNLMSTTSNKVHVKNTNSQCGKKQGLGMNGDLKCLQSSPSTSVSYCSRSFLLESGSPGSPVASHSKGTCCMRKEKDLKAAST